MQTSPNSFPEGDFWDIFKLILSIPHQSGKEDTLAKKLYDEAVRRGLDAKFDDYGNLRIDRPAAPGFEELPEVIMQGHLDMVCEKSSDVVFDFDRNGIECKIENGFIHSCGTTLGADNGIGCAMALALLFDENFKGRAIAGVFTKEEETGLLGATNLAPDMLKGKYLLNLDSDNDGVFCIGCAGGAKTEIELDTPLVQSKSGNHAEIRVSGLPGGHSGVMIADKHGNALVFLAQILEKIKADVADIHCSNADNVIPSEAAAKIITDTNLKELEQQIKSMKEQFQKTLADGIDFDISVKPTAENALMWKPEWKNRLISAMANVPNGVLEFAPEFNVPRTSSNFASAVVKNGRITLRLSQRSLDNNKRDAAVKEVLGAFGELDFKHNISGVYSGWKPVENAHINHIASGIWEKMYGSKPQLQVIHAGLETGIIGEKNPELELISFGPNAYDIHSVKERLEISSAEKVFAFLKELVKAL